MVDAELQSHAVLQEYLRDGWHPNMHFLNNVLNIYLNLLTDGDSSGGLDTLVSNNDAPATRESATYRRVMRKSLPSDTLVG